MKHFSELTIDAAKPWVVVGKGPSFDPKKIGEFKSRGFRLCAINQAFEASEEVFDLSVFYDWQAAERFSQNGIRRVLAFITQTKKPGEGIEFYHALPFGDELRGKCYFFDALERLMYPNLEPVSIRTSSAEAALTILARAGVKDVHFLGCDGTFEHHSLFEPRGSRRFLELQFITFAELQNSFGLNFYGLPEKYERYGGKISQC